MPVRRAALATTAVVGTMLALASFAWACTDFTKIDSLTPATDPTAATAAVRGSGAAAGSLVVLRWNALNGPVIARAEADASGAFTAQATIPEAPAGLYTVIADDGHNPVARAAYEVAPAPAGALLTSTGAADPAVKAKTSPGFATPSSSPLPTAGIAVFGAGLLALASAFTVLTARRRKALASH